MDLIELFSGKGIGYKKFKTDPESMQKFMRKMEILYAVIVNGPTLDDQVINNGETVTFEGQVLTHRPLFKNIP